MNAPTSDDRLPGTLRAGSYNLATAPASTRTSYTHVDLALSPPETNMQNNSELPSAQTTITFLLVTGKRRTMSFDPETTIRRLKELVWTGWPAEWSSDTQTPQPPSPSYLRVLYLGRMLQDEDTLAKLSFPAHVASNTAPPPMIVHISVRSTPPPVEDPDALKKKFTLRRRSTGASAGARAEGADANPAASTEEGAGCCCVVC